MSAAGQPGQPGQPGMSTTQIVAVTLAALVVTIGAAVLWLQIAKVRAVLKSIETAMWETPLDDSGVESSDLRRCVRSYAVRVDLASGASLDGDSPNPGMQDDIRASCQPSPGNNKGDGVQVDAGYAKTFWLVMHADGHANALHDDVRQGRVKYALVSGMTTRIQAADDVPHAMAHLASSPLKTGLAARRVFLIALVNDLVLPSHLPTGCTARSTWPLPAGSSNAGRLRFIVTGAGGGTHGAARGSRAAAPTASELQTYLWGWGAVGG